MAVALLLGLLVHVLLAAVVMVVGPRHGDCWGRIEDGVRASWLVREELALPVLLPL